MKESCESRNIADSCGPLLKFFTSPHLVYICRVRPLGPSSVHVPADTKLQVMCSATLLQRIYPGVPYFLNIRGSRCEGTYDFVHTDHLRYRLPCAEIYEAVNLQTTCDYHIPGWRWFQKYEQDAKTLSCKSCCMSETENTRLEDKISFRRLATAAL